MLGVAAKLMVAIVPAQIGDYQLTKTLSAQLKEANNNNETAKQFVERVNRQLSINADYDTQAEDVFTFIDKRRDNWLFVKNMQSPTISLVMLISSIASKVISI